eukprot:g7922.t1
MDMEQLVVNRKDGRQARLVPCAPEPAPESLAEGEILMRCIKVNLTANTVTYALAGEDKLLNYFGHFPLDDAEYALSPAWGVAVVAGSRCAGFDVGMRVGGFYPMAPWCILRPKGPPRGMRFVDGTPHRQRFFKPYQEYLVRPRPDTEDEEDATSLSDMGLFMTGWGMPHEASMMEPAAPQVLLLTSASSRTALAAAFTATRDERLRGLKVIGLTSEANAAYCRGTGLYAEVHTYGAEARLPRARTAVYDMSGNAAVQARVRERLGAALVAWRGVGFADAADAARQAAARASGNEQPPKLHGGPRATLYLVFQATELYGEKYGKDALQGDMMQAFFEYAEWKMPSFKAERTFGAQAALDVWERTVHNQCDPATAYVVSLWPDKAAQAAAEAPAAPARL